METNLNIFNLWSDVWGIKLKKLINESNIETWEKDFIEALKEAKSKKARSILFRLEHQDDSDLLLKKLVNLGFKRKHTRVEYKKSLSDIPSNNETPLNWKTAEELDWSLEKIGAFLKLIAQGDPDYNPDEDPLDFIQDWIDDPVLTSGRDCIAIGFYDSKPVTLLVAQVNLKTGWSRIAYMGVLPEFRSKSLGKWVHRKGFEMMKLQGGTLYHGGTTSTNTSMIKLFEKHQCQLHCKMEELEYIIN